METTKLFGKTYINNVTYLFHAPTYYDGVVLFIGTPVEFMNIPYSEIVQYEPYLVVKPYSKNFDSKLQYKIDEYNQRNN